MREAGLDVDRQDDVADRHSGQGEDREQSEGHPFADDGAQTDARHDEGGAQGQSGEQAEPFEQGYGDDAADGEHESRQSREQTGLPFGQGKSVADFGEHGPQGGGGWAQRGGDEDEAGQRQNVEAAVASESQLGRSRHGLILSDRCSRRARGPLPHRGTQTSTASDGIPFDGRRLSR